MICVGGPFDGMTLHSDRDVFRLVLSKGQYEPRKNHWLWVPDATD